MSDDDIKYLKSCLDFGLTKLALLDNRTIIDVIVIRENKAKLDTGDNISLKDYSLSDFIVYDYIDSRCEIKE